MERRDYLRSVALGVAGTLGGCLGAQVAPPSESITPEPTSDRRLRDVPLPVPKSELYQAIHSVIPAIVEPAFAADWTGIEIEVGSGTYEPRLRAETPVIGVERHGVSRAYPLGILERHEVVNDAVTRSAGDSEPLLVTYCPSCGSSMTAIRRVRGNRSLFEVSHFLWRSNLVLRDGATGSLWSQLLAGAIRGPATGEQLTLVPSTLTSWGAWREANPETNVLLPPPRSKALYGIGGERYEYGRFTGTAPIIGEDDTGQGTGRTLVIGISAGGAATAYPFEVVRSEGVVNDVVGSTPVVVTVGAGGTLVAYERQVAGEILRFRRSDDRTLAAGGSRWLIEAGVAIDGPFEGRQLRRANDVPPLFRFAWEDFHPNSALYDGEG